MGGFFSSSLGIAALVIGILVIVYFVNPKPKIIEQETEKGQIDQVAVSKISSAKEEDIERQNEAEIVAAIMGALSTYLEVPASKLRIKSIKRVNGNESVWRERALEEF